MTNLTSTIKESVMITLALVGALVVSLVYLAVIILITSPIIYLGTALIIATLDMIKDFLH